MKRMLFLILLVLAGCNLPKDPEDSLAHARAAGLRVGVVHRPPFCFMKNGVANGSEVAMVKDFAQKEGLKVIYVYGTESVLAKQLEEYRLDLLLGGYEKDTEWNKKTGITTDYNGTNCLLLAPGENALLYKLEEHLLKLKEHGRKKI